MNEPDFAALFSWEATKASKALLNEGVWNVAHGPSGNLTVREERTVQIGDVDAGDELLDAPASPRGPFIDVGHKRDGPVRAPDHESNGFGVLVAMRHDKRRHGEFFSQANPAAGAQSLQANVAKADELAPRTVSAQKPTHPRHGVYWYLTSAHRFPSEVHQAGVMTHVAVGDKDAVEPRRSGRRRSELI